MTWDLPAILVVVAGSIAGGVLVMLWQLRLERRQTASLAALASRLLCPRCGTQTLEFDGSFWMESSHSPRETSGPCFRCKACDGSFAITYGGELLPEPESDRLPDG